MALRSPSRTRRQDVRPRDSPSAGGSGNGARADVARKMLEVKILLANLEEEGVEIDGKIASIIDDEIAGIQDEADREGSINGLKRNGLMVLLSITSFTMGFFLGACSVDQSFYGQLCKIAFSFGEK